MGHQILLFVQNAGVAPTPLICLAIFKATV
jgi:hypothetical protein